MAGLKAWADDCGAIEVAWSAPARRLHRDDSGPVDGVETDDFRVRARRGVVLSCGGFEHDEQMKADYLPARPVHFSSSPASTSDGIGWRSPPAPTSGK